MKVTKKAFTLIEMLIVIVIIGILAAALVPRLVSVQGRARDTKRKADLSQIGSALAIYKTDNATFPAASGNVALVIANQYLSGYLTSTPTDPVSSAGIPEIGAVATNTGYGYLSVTRNGVTSNGAVLAAQTESDGTSSNAIIYTGTMNHSATAESLDTYLGTCNGRATKGTTFAPATCTAPATGLRYYYVQ